MQIHSRRAGAKRTEFIEEVAYKHKAGLLEHRQSADQRMGCFKSHDLDFRIWPASFIVKENKDQMGDEWTILEKLLLSQAVYKYGEDNWFQVARNLKHHALLDRPSDYFNQKNCSHQYYSMVSELNKEKKDASTNDMPAVVQLARQLYTLRLEELKRAISQDEEKFLTLVAEIDDIRAGKWDNQLLGLPATSEENSPSKGAESTNTPTANIDSTTEAASTQPEVMETSSTESSNISDKQPSPLPSGEALEKLAKQEIAAEEAAKVETENIENEARDVRKKDAPPITTEEQQREMANAENNLASSAAAPYETNITTTHKAL
ncbi:hypothetical protein G6F42_013771 [Rhizopus arrhizus]|nr:hypothetical protein G6F42_013771 [Rhizopus arrhizus]